MSCGFRKMAAWVEQKNPDTRSCFVSTNHFGGLRYLKGQMGGAPVFDAAAVDEVAQGLKGADVIGFSSMTGYADMTKALVDRIREISPSSYLVWGGIHPIIHPEDAIASNVDAICNGEGEFAFDEFFDAYKAGRDFTDVKNFWFKSKSGDVVRNGFRPLMTGEDMEGLPFPKYGENEWIYKKGEGLVPVTVADYLATNGLGYNAIWSIGCPFHCTYCGNTKFIANDPKYKKLRHPSARYCIDEIKAAVQKHPHISTVNFHDDSFMAVPYRDLEKFAELWHDEVKLPFSVFGVIPNYVKKEKFEILTWAGMNRIRMGIQTGSERILEFYKRPTPVKRIKEAAEVCASFAPKYHIPPAYDIITDNPVETREDVIETLEVLYELARPFTLNLFSLKVIPNTEMERMLAERGIDVDAVSSSFRNIPPKWANLLLYVVTLTHPPRWLFDLLLEKVEAPRAEQDEYPNLHLLLRTIYFASRAKDHLRHMDFSTIQGPVGYWAWKSGLIAAWKKLSPKLPRPPRPELAPEAEPKSPVLSSAVTEQKAPAGRRLNLVVAGGRKAG